MRSMSETTMSPAGPLALIFNANTALLSKAFDGVGPDQLWHRPSLENNPMLWIAGHMVGTRALMLQILGDPLDTGWGTLFGRGAVLGDEARYPSRDEVLKVHATVAARVQAKLLSMTADQLGAAATAGPKPAGVSTVGEQIGFFALHDSYHLGQLGYIRKALGLPNLVG
jgi:hypothetical protein